MIHSARCTEFAHDMHRARYVAVFWGVSSAGPAVETVVSVSERECHARGIGSREFMHFMRRRLETAIAILRMQEAALRMLPPHREALP